MSNSSNFEIEREFARLINKGNLTEAKQLIQSIEQKGSLSIEDKLLCLHFRGFLEFTEFSFINSIEIAQELYEESKKHENSIRTIDALLLLFVAGFYTSRIHWNVLGKFIQETEDLIKILPKEPKDMISARTGRMYHYKSLFYYNRGDLELALEYSKIALEIYGQFEIFSSLRPYVLDLMGFIYSARGELEKSINISKESLRLYGKLINIDPKFSPTANLYRGLGNTYYRQGNLELAIKNYEKALRLNVEIVYVNTWVYLFLIQIYLDKNSPEKAKEYFNQLKTYSINHPHPVNEPVLILSEARILKSSRRVKNLAKSEELLKNLLERDGLSLNFVVFVFIELCDLLLIELKISDEIEILDEAESFILQLLKLAEEQHSFLVLTQARFLQGKLALIKMNMGDSRRFLTEAQQLADEHGLQILARTISKEHDTLLGQLDIWDNLNRIKAPISERLKLATIDETFDHISEKRAIEPPLLTSETPVLLLIIEEGGVLVFSNAFIEGWTDEEDLIGNFLSAFNTFSGELFSKGLDRAIFGDFTILMESVSHFSICYLFKGQTYPAKKKITMFMERIQEIKEIFQSLEKFYKMSQVANIKNLPVLESLINEIF
jgi:tetratricopeptide (TPR) repeat protein